VDAIGVLGELDWGEKSMQLGNTDNFIEIGLRVEIIKSLFNLLGRCINVFYSLKVNPIGVCLGDRSTRLGLIGECHWGMNFF
jgi:hypothetical protein